MLEKRVVKHGEVEQAVKTILEYMGMDINDPNVKDTPSRVRKMYEEFSLVKVRPDFTTFKDDSEQVVSVENLEVRSLCQHHLAPFIGVAQVVYIPKDKKAGLSKFQRVLDYVANRPHDQEALTKQYAEYLISGLEPVSLVVNMKCSHTCMTVRGVKTHSAQTTTYFRHGAERGLRTIEEFLKFSK